MIQEIYVIASAEPIKAFLQKKDAVKYGRVYKTAHPDLVITLYAQPITRSGVMHRICDLTRYGVLDCIWQSKDWLAAHIVQSGCNSC